VVASFQGADRSRGFHGATRRFGGSFIMLLEDILDRIYEEQDEHEHVMRNQDAVTEDHIGDGNVVATGEFPRHR
jgi:hypothetical protein